MTIRHAFSVVILLIVQIAPSSGEDKKSDAKESAKHAGFEQIKKLVGEWEGTETGKKDFKVHAVYKLTSGGSAVVETLFPGTDHEMVTVIHPDGDDIVLTHYCMLGNQPQMKASSKGEGKLDFKFVRATNLKSPDDMHMHDVTFTFVDKDTLREEWTNFNKGKEAGKVVFELKRKN